MQFAQKILAPIDLSINSELPVAHAIRVADAMGAELTLLHVVDRNAEQRRGRVVWPSNAVCGESRAVHRLAIPGVPSETIVRYATFANADMLLMTSPNSRGWARYWKPSVTDKVMQSTPKPVYLANRVSVDKGSNFRCRRILCVLNLDGTDGPVIHHAQALAERFDGALILLGIVPSVDEGLLLEVLDGLDRPLSTHLAAGRIRALGKRVSVPYETSVMTGSPYRCISTAAREYNADIVVALRTTSKWPQAYPLDIRSLQRRLSCPVISVSGRLPLVRPVEEVAAVEARQFSSVSGF
ncbi:MAG: universal stress protein [Acidobacteriota bacterium]